MKWATTDKVSMLRYIEYLEKENKLLKGCLDDCKKYAECKAPDKILELVKREVRRIK